MVRTAHPPMIAKPSKTSRRLSAVPKARLAARLASGIVCAPVFIFFTFFIVANILAQNSPIPDAPVSNIPPASHQTQGSPSARLWGEERQLKRVRHFVKHKTHTPQKTVGSPFAAEPGSKAC